ncbi:MAG: hypothetical protein R6W31_11355 [Bacteroidales bacterium]
MKEKPKHELDISPHLQEFSDRIDRRKKLEKARREQRRRKALRFNLIVWPSAIVICGISLLPIILFTTEGKTDGFISRNDIVLASSLIILFAGAFFLVRVVQKWIK